MMAWSHGTKYGYDQGCRCAACRDAKMAKRRESRARSRAANTPGYQRELAVARALKETYRGTCKVCGKATSGANGPGTASDICAPCVGRRTPAARRGTGPVTERALALLAEKPLRFTELYTALGITKEHAATLVNRLLRYGLVERPSRGLYRKAAA